MKRANLFLIFFTMVLLFSGCGNNGKARQYEVYFTQAEECLVLEEETIGKATDGHLTISLLETQGPTEFQVKVLWKSAGAEQYELGQSFSVTLGNGRAITLPPGATFCVKATAVSGQNGYGTFQIVTS